MNTDRVTKLLARAQENEPGAKHKLFEAIYDELRAIARGQMAREKAGHTLQATALVHEAYFRVLGTEHFSLENRRHLFGAFAEAMRQILVESARRRNALKRGGDRERVPMDDFEVESDDPAIDIIALDEALKRFEKEDQRAAEVVRLRVYACRKEEEIADLLGVSTKTVQRDWNYAKAWLGDAISGRSQGD